MSFVQINAPSVLPITLNDAKSHLRVTGAQEDTLITDLIAAATAFLERETGLCLIDQSLRLWADTLQAENIVCLPKHPVQNIIQVTWYDAHGTPIILPSSAYFLNSTTRPARLSFDRASCPQGNCNGIEIDFTAGFGETGTDVPDMIKRALLVLVAHWYEFRGVFSPQDQPVSVPPLYARLIRHYKPLGL